MGFENKHQIYFFSNIEQFILHTLDGDVHNCVVRNIVLLPKVGQCFQILLLIIYLTQCSTSSFKSLNINLTKFIFIISYLIKKIREINF